MAPNDGDENTDLGCNFQLSGYFPDGKLTILVSIAKFASPAITLTLPCLYDLAANPLADVLP